MKKQMQAKKEEMRDGGREAYPIKIIKTAGRTLEQTLVKTDLMATSAQMKNMNQRRTRRTKSTAGGMV